MIRIALAGMFAISSGEVVDLGGVADAGMVMLTDENEFPTIAGVPVKNYHHAYQGLTEVDQESPSMRAQGAADVQVVGKGRREKWVAMLKRGTAQEQVHAICESARAHCIRRVSGKFPFVALHDLTESDLAAVASAAPGAIAYFEPDLVMTATPEVVDSFSPPPVPEGMVRGARTQPRGIWNMITTGAAKRPSSAGAGTHIFILDTGINTRHQEFGGRAIPWVDTTGCLLECGPGDVKTCDPSDTTCAFDVNGHGTHCAGSAAGETVGIAPLATLYAVKVLSDRGSGALSGIFEGLSQILDSTLRPAVASMSLGGPKQPGGGYEDAINALFDDGVVVVVAAGNEFKDACDFSPAHVPAAITVGSTNSINVRSNFSNWGSCMDIYAPGTDIESANAEGVDLYMTISGTSMACPHVAGAAAIVMGRSPSLPPAEVLNVVQNTSGTNYVERLSPEDSYNTLLYVGEDGPPEELSPREQISWPPPEFFAACDGLFDRGPLEQYGRANCQCLTGSTCYNGEVRGCPISPELEALQPANPDVVLNEMFYLWDCEECNCQLGLLDIILAFLQVAGIFVGLCCCCCCVLPIGVGCYCCLSSSKPTTPPANAAGANPYAANPYAANPYAAGGAIQMGQPGNYAQQPMQQVQPMQ